MADPSCSDFNMVTVLYEVRRRANRMTCDDDGWEFKTIFVYVVG